MEWKFHKITSAPPWNGMEYFHVIPYVLIPLNSMKFHTWKILSGMFHGIYKFHTWNHFMWNIPWNLMELFHGIPWNRSMELSI